MVSIGSKLGKIYTPSVVVDDVSDILDKKNDTIAVIISKNKNNQTRASATAVGAAGAALWDIGVLATYILAKLSNKTIKTNTLNNFANKIDQKAMVHWASKGTKGVFNKGVKYLAYKGGLGILWGALSGFAFGVYATYKNNKVDRMVKCAKEADNNDASVISGLNSLNKSKFGRQIIHDSIIKKNDKSVTIKFSGVNKEYNITNDELIDASHQYNTTLDKNGNATSYHKKYTKTDGDVLAIEIAFDKYLEDLKNNKISKLNHPDYVTNYEQSITDKDRNGIRQFYYLMTGHQVSRVDNVSKKENEPNLLKLYSKVQYYNFLDKYTSNSEKYVASVTFKENETKTLNLKGIMNFKYKLNTDKVYAVKTINKDNISLIDPMKPKDRIIIPISTFSNVVDSVYYIEKTQTE